MVITENAFDARHVEFGCKDPGSHYNIKVKRDNVDVGQLQLGKLSGKLKNCDFKTEWEAIQQAVKRHPKAVSSGPNRNAATEEEEISMRVKDEEGGPYMVLSCFVEAIIEATNRPTSGLARLLRGKRGDEQDKLEVQVTYIDLSEIFEEYLRKDEFAVPALENLDSSREELDRHLGFAPFDRHAVDLTEWLYKVGWKLQDAAKDGQLDRFIPSQVENNKSFTSGELSPNLVPPYFAPFYEALNGLLDNSRSLSPDDIKGRAKDVLAILEQGLKEVRELTDSNDK
jgi:hypothetical protein